MSMFETSATLLSASWHAWTRCGLSSHARGGWRGKHNPSFIGRTRHVWSARWLISNSFKVGWAGIFNLLYLWLVPLGLITSHNSLAKTYCWLVYHIVYPHNDSAHSYGTFSTFFWIDLFALLPLSFFACSMLQEHLTTRLFAAAVPKENVFSWFVWLERSIPLNGWAYKTNIYYKKPWYDGSS